MCEVHHGYGSVGKVGMFFGVYEYESLVAVFSWQPPPPGAAKSICPEAPEGVLSLSRMAAVPKEHRGLKRISKALKYQMRHVIDRTRWPVLVTYQDTSLSNPNGLPHDGAVYRYSGWERLDKPLKRYAYVNNGVRTSSYNCGKRAKQIGAERKEVILYRWEDWACPRGSTAVWMANHGWRRVPIPGKVWASGNPAFTFEKERGVS
jgi:hypothetical protein